MPDNQQHRIHEVRADRQGGRFLDGYVATERQSHGEYQEPCPRGPLPKGATRVDRMRRKLKTKAGKAVYATRKAIVEPVWRQLFLYRPRAHSSAGSSSPRWSWP
jgi:hypothetical protein